MWSLARGIAQYSLKNSREYPKTSGAIPRFLDILSRLFVNILQSTLANLHILLQFRQHHMRTNSKGKHAWKGRL